LANNRLWVRGAPATAGVAAFRHSMAQPIVGIAEPSFAPPLAAAILLSAFRSAKPRRSPMSAAASARSSAPIS
jgi:hypothetical protein